MGQEKTSWIVNAYRFSQEENGKRVRQEEVEIIDSKKENGVETYIVQTKDGIQCTTVYNIFTNTYYADDIYGVIKNCPEKAKDEIEM